MEDLEKKIFDLDIKQEDYNSKLEKDYKTKKDLDNFKSIQFNKN